MDIVGIDTGGTFTDFVARIDGKWRIEKRSSTPDDPARVVLELLVDNGVAGRPGSIVHGSTVATNTLLERRGARTAFVTTRGFADVIEIGRQDRSDIYAMHPVRPQPLVPAELRFEVDERIGAGGRVIVPLETDEIERVCECLRNCGAESIAIGLLFAPEAPQHEQRLCAQIAKLGIPVVTSTGVLPELREFERFSTTVMSAYVAPRMEGYVQRIAERAAPARLQLMDSSGGTMDWRRLRGHAVRTVLSGPAGGAVAAEVLARAQRRDLLAFDMGGTSTDASLVLDGTCARTRAAAIGGLPIALPMLDICSVGAGGGSMAWIDAGGALRVGPQSAGSTPGPICYGRGGSTPTVTDANLLLGRLPRDVKLGGVFALAASGVEAKFAELGARLGLSVLELATGVVQVVEAEMARALRRISQERGVDPRRLALLAFGGASGLHAVSLARTLGIEEVIIPSQPGLFCALGTLLAPATETTATSLTALLDDSLLPRLRNSAQTLEASARAQIAVAYPDQATQATADWELAVRYFGQAHEIDIAFDRANTDAQKLRQSFEARYRERFGHLHASRTVEVAALRCRVSLPPLLAGNEVPALGMGASPREPSTSTVWDDDGRGGLVRVEARRLDRRHLQRGAQLVGPALVEELSGTLWLPRGARLSVRADDSLGVEVGSRAR
ncbi:MAG: hydantoinase/oxoprolinase family protein [Planctomycetota bacterium]